MILPNLILRVALYKQPVLVTSMMEAVSLNKVAIPRGMVLQLPSPHYLWTILNYTLRILIQGSESCTSASLLPQSS